MLASEQPMFIAWGESRTMLYNDGYAPLCGGKHPWALGKRFNEVWSEIIDDVGPIMDAAYAGIPTYMDDIQFTMLRNGFPEITHFSFGYTPVHDNQTDEVVGMFCTCQETSKEVALSHSRATENEKLKAMFEQAPGAIAILYGQTHIYDVANPAYLDLVGNRDVLGKTVAETLPEVVRQGFIDVLDRVYRTGEPFIGKGVNVDLANSKGELRQRILDFVYQPIRDLEGRVTGIFVEATDVTETQLLHRKIEQNRAELLTIANALPIAVAMLDNQFHYKFVNEAAARFAGLAVADIVGRHTRDIVGEDNYERRASSLQRALAGERTSFEVHHDTADGTERYFQMEYIPNRLPSGEIDGIFVTAEDVTTRRKSENMQEILNRELGHRMKNQLALVQGIVNQTFRYHGHDMNDAKKAIASRIAALSSAHDLLINRHENSRTISEVVQNAIAPFVEADSARFEISGPDIPVGRTVGLSLALILNELATNSTKYGSLSADGGVVEISWNILESDFVLEWKDRNGPAVAAPEREGFGTKLIRNGLPGGAGATELQFLPTGVSCKIATPVGELETDR